MVFNQLPDEFLQSLASIKNKKIKERLQRAFASATSINDIQDTIAKKNTKWRRELRVEAFFTILEKFGKALDILSQAIPSSTVALVWGALRVVLEVRSTFRNANEVITKCLQEISESLPRCEDYSSGFPELSKNLRHAMELLYSDILKFFTHVVVFYARPAIYRLIQGALKNPVKEFGDILEDIRQHGVLVDRECTAWRMKRTLKDIQDVVDYNSSTLAKDIRLWLSPCDQEAVHSQIQRDILPESVSWLWKDRAFATWSTGTQTNNRLFWVRGNPGTGKTFLTSSLIEKVRTDPTVTVFHFYFDEAESNQNSSDAMVRSFLIQMMNRISPTHITSLMDRLTSTYRASCEQTAHTFRPLWDVFVDSLPLFSSSWCMIDGLDECQDRSRVRLLDCITHLAQSGQAKVFVSAQEKTDIATAMDPTFYPGLSITNQHQQLIDAFVDREVLALNLPPISKSLDIKIKAIGHLKRKSEGSFLCAKMSIRDLERQPTWKDVLQALDNLPAGLLGLYRTILERFVKSLSSAEKTLTIKLLGWVSVAFTPLHLDAIVDAVAVTDYQIDDTKRFDPKEFVYRCCSPFLTIHSDGTLRFIHSSAKDFLIDLDESRISAAQGLGDFHVQPALAHRLSAESCLAHLRDLSAEKMAGPPTMTLGNTANDPITFTRYAAICWQHHVEYSGPVDQRLFSQVAGFLDSRDAYTLFSLLVELQPLVGDFAGHLVMMQGSLQRWMFGYEVPVDKLATMADRVIIICERGLREQEKTYGLFEKRVIRSLHSIGKVYESHARLEDAEKTYREAIARWDRRLGPNSLDAYRVKFDLWRAVGNQAGKLDQCALILEDTLQGFERELGKSHLETLSVKAKLASQRVYQGRFDEAEKFHTYVLQERERQLGPDHPDTLRSVCSLAYLFWEKADFQRSFDLQSRLVRGRDRSLGVKHPATLSAVRGLAFICEKLGDEVLMKQYHERAAAGWEEVMNRKYDHTLEGLAMRAVIYANPWSRGHRGGWTKVEGCKCEHWLGGNSCWGGNL